MESRLCPANSIKMLMGYACSSNYIPKILKIQFIGSQTTPPKPIKLKFVILRSLVSRLSYTTHIDRCFCLLNHDDALDRNTHTQPFYGPFSGTIWVSQCQ